MDIVSPAIVRSRFAFTTNLNLANLMVAASVSEREIRSYSSPSKSYPINVKVISLLG